MVEQGSGGDGREALVAAGYDAVYEGASHSPTLQRIWQECASGADYPTEFGNISFVTVAELARLAAETHQPRFPAVRLRGRREGRHSTRSRGFPARWS